MGYLLSKLKKLFSKDRNQTDLVPDRSISNHPAIDKLETKIPYQVTPEIYEKSTNDSRVDANSDLGSKTEVIVEKTKDFKSYKTRCLNVLNIGAAEQSDKIATSIDHTAQLQFKGEFAKAADIFNSDDNLDEIFTHLHVFNKKTVTELLSNEQRKAVGLDK